MHAGLQSPAALPASLLGGRRRASAQPSLTPPEIYNMHTYSMPYSAPADVDPANVLCALITSTRPKWPCLLTQNETAVMYLPR